MRAVPFVGVPYPNTKMRPFASLSIGTNLKVTMPRYPVFRGKKKVLRLYVLYDDIV